MGLRFNNANESPSLPMKPDGGAGSMLPHPSWLSYAWIALRGAQMESRLPRGWRRAFRRRLGNDAATPGLWMRLAPHVFPTWPPHAQAWRTWFAMSPVMQWHRVLEAWVALAQTPRLRRVRKRILMTLHVQTATARRAVYTLRHLGIWHPSTGWAPWARNLLLAKRLPPTPPPSPWLWEPPFLRIPFPAQWSLVERLERWLRPLKPGLYDLRQPLSEEAWTLLQTVLEQGLGRPWHWAKRPIAPVHVQQGVLVTFASPEALDRWLTPYRRRRWAAVRLGPHHVWIPANRARNLARALRRSRLHLLPQPPRLQPRAPVQDPWGKCIAQALREGKPLSLRYRDAKGHETERVITPWSLEVRGGEVYLRGYDHTRNAERLLLVRRIRDIQMLHPDGAT